MSDTERLDWLEKNMNQLRCSLHGYTLEAAGGRNFRGPSVREAIDDAMKATKADGDEPSDAAAAAALGSINA
jgi:hypothetical protein